MEIVSLYIEKGKIVKKEGLLFKANPGHALPDSNGKLTSYVKYIGETAVLVSEKIGEKNNGLILNAEVKRSGDGVYLVPSIESAGTKDYRVIVYCELLGGSFAVPVSGVTACCAQYDERSSVWEKDDPTQCLMVLDAGECLYIYMDKNMEKRHKITNMGDEIYISP